MLVLHVPVQYHCYNFIPTKNVTYSLSIPLKTKDNLDGPKLPFDIEWPNWACDKIPSIFIYLLFFVCVEKKTPT